MTTVSKQVYDELLDSVILKYQKYLDDADITIIKDSVNIFSQKTVFKVYKKERLVSLVAVVMIYDDLHTIEHSYPRTDLFKIKHLLEKDTILNVLLVQVDKTDYSISNSEIILINDPILNS
jgi:hypothetical protein